MKILITGSSGHLGEALVRTLTSQGHEIVAMDKMPSHFTTHPGSVVDRTFVKNCMTGVQAVLHTATLHKPHIATHTHQEFVDTNITGTLNLLEEAVAAGVKSFVFTSTTSTFGDALTPDKDSPATWITEDTVPIPKNIYGITKLAAENLCSLFHRNHGLPVIILRTSRFFPEEDDSKEKRLSFSNDNAKVNEFLYRRVDVHDIVHAHQLAMEKAPAIGFGNYIISATTPFTKGDLNELHLNAPAVVAGIYPDFEKEFLRRGWKMFPVIDRVYVNEAARTNLGWWPKFDFRYILDRLKQGLDYRSDLAITIGSKGYHIQKFGEGPYPVR